MIKTEGSSTNSCSTVLLVDDDKIVLKATSRVLAELEISLLTAENAAEALALCHDHEVAVLISDHRMPGITGIALLQEIKSLYPATIRILMTGDSNCREVSEAVSQGLIATLISKPWDYEEIIEAVTLGLSQYNTAVTDQARDGHR